MARRAVRADLGGQGTPTSREQASRPAISHPLSSIIHPSARSRWQGPLAGSYTPTRVERVLRSALSGNLTAQWELFDLMEDTSPRISKNLNELKRAVKAYDRSFAPWAEEDEAPSAEARSRARLVSRALWTMRSRADENQNGFDDTLYDILDAWGKGVSVLEIDWEVRLAGKAGLITAPRCTRWIHPRFYGYPPQQDWLGLNLTEIGLASANAGSSMLDATRNTQHVGNLQPTDGVFARFPQNKFLVCVSKQKSGHASVGALLRPLAFWWAASNFAQQWFLNFAQIFGLPIRWANYDPAVPGLMEQVTEMLTNMGNSAWGVFPTGTTIELQEPSRGTVENPQVSLLDRAERQYDILILGQTLTTDVRESGSRALGDVHKTVRDDIVRAAADFVAGVVNQQLIPAVIALNYNDHELPPELSLEPRKIEDARANAERDQILLGQGVALPKSWFYKRHNIPLPQEDEETVATAYDRHTQRAAIGGAA